MADEYFDSLPNRQHKQRTHDDTKNNTQQHTTNIRESGVSKIQTTRPKDLHLSTGLCQQAQKVRIQPDDDSVFPVPGRPELLGVGTQIKFMHDFAYHTHEELPVICEEVQLPLAAIDKLINDQVKVFRGTKCLSK